MPKAVRTASAERDLEEIGFHISVVDDRPEVAESVVKELIAKCDKLAELAPTSTMGTPAPEIGVDVRLFSCRRWVILFRYTTDGIVVLRIVDGSRDYFSWKLGEVLDD